MTRKRKSLPEDPARDDPGAQLIEFFAAQLDHSRVSRAVDEAQEVMFDAWECADRRKRVAMARKALKISGECADAYCALAEDAAETLEERVDFYRQGVAAGERALGPAAFVDGAGMFWGLLETRPYMRARAGLAMALWEWGDREEAVSHGMAMLDLNPNDNQGVRYLVVIWLQQLGRNTDTEALLRLYKDDAGCQWAWPAALAAFRRGGDSAEARKALSRAVASNRHVTDYLLGRKRFPVTQSAYVTWGGADEAAAYVEHAAESWAMTPGAIAWVAAQAGAPRAAPRKSRRQ